ALRQVVPGVKLSEAKRIVESGADEALMRAFDLVMEQHRSSVRAERREELVRAAAGEAYRAWLLNGGEPERVVEFADRLLAELDRRRDAELEEARDE
ncbi:MAG TPA: hypothetical protein VF202_10560, partial [Trueperaceae bacterium]